MKHVINSSSRFVIAFFVLFAIASASFGQKLASVTKGGEGESAISATVVPVKNAGDNRNANCATLNSLHTSAGGGDTRFSHIITNNELKLDFSDPNGTFPFTANDNPPFRRELIGPSSPGQSVTITSGSSQVDSWSSTIQITAVILKLGPNSYAYPYKPFKSSDTDLDPSDVFPDANQGLSHVTFCFGEPTGSTAGEGSISGRVIDANGNGVSKAQMVLINGATGESKITMTSPFGYYTFTGLDVNELYVLNVNHKRFTFGEKQRTISLGDDLMDVQFVASPRE